MTEPRGESVFPRIAGYYNNLVDKYGHEPRACDYGRAASQTAKFKVLAELMPMDGLRVLDVGCGFADFANYLSAKYRNLDYHGIDLSPRMIEEARRLHPQLDLQVANLLTFAPEDKYDVVMANGIFYLLGAEAWPTMKSLIERMMSLARRAIAFNTLSSWAPADKTDEFRASPERTLEFCRSLSPHLVLRHDYLPHDFTVYLYRREEP